MIPGWEPEQLGTLRHAIERVRSGAATVVWIEGEAGVGKTSLLQELDGLLKGFTVLRADGIESVAEAYEVAAQWDQQLAADLSTGRRRPFVAAQHLRELTDRLLASGPVCLSLDDMHWADEETVEALSWLMRRAKRDQILVAVSSRPLAPAQHREWRRWASHSDDICRLQLVGLSLGRARAVVRDRFPMMTDAEAERLWQHTAGNPLYLRALVDEYGYADLARNRTLPAPTEYAQLVGNRLARQSSETVGLAHAAAVLGGLAVPVRAASAVAAVTDPSAAVDALRQADLVTLDDSGGDLRVRWRHALVRSAVYLQIGLGERKALHLRAAKVVDTLSAALEHRVDAADQYDDQLAADLESFARVQHDQLLHRRAASSLRSASGLTGDVSRRRSRWLDSLYESLLARDLTVVEPELLDVAEAADHPRRALVLALHRMLTGRISEGAAILAATRPEAGTADPMVEFRLETLLAWARVNLGHDDELISEGLARMASLGVHDPALRGQELLVQVQVAGRTGDWPSFLARLGQLPEVPSAMPAQLTMMLAWRGALQAASGLVTGGIADLAELQLRLRTSQADVISTGMDALLGWAHWLAGHFELAALCFRSAQDVPPGSVGLLVYACRTLVASVQGDFAVADPALAEGGEILTEMAWADAVNMLIVAEVVRLHAGDSDDARAGFLATVRRRWPRLRSGTGVTTGLILGHLVLAMVWAGDTEPAERLLTGIEQEPLSGPCMSGFVGWLRGLLTQRQGQPEVALRHFETALQADCSALPLYRAHLLTDYARLAAEGGPTAATQAALTEATALYRGLGATTYLARLNAMQQPTAGSPADEVVLHLSDRENDVLTLVVEGFSYAQIARQLYISQSTVSYHLGHIYAKADVTSRHALTAWVRSHPGAVAATSH